MKRGLVIGKFMPLHLGHIALIDFAASHCDELIVSMSYTDKDPIPGPLRHTWIERCFQDRPCIKTAIVKDDFDDESLPMERRTRLWCDFIRRTYPLIDVVFSSESYGEPFAETLGATHVSFDPERESYAVSASMIREHPLQYWDFIPSVVRPYFVRKVCFYGPESTGKSTMAIEMAEWYETEFVPEVAREMIKSNNFTVEDIIAIGHAHLQRIEEKTNIANKILFCDTDAITTQIYSRHYLHVVPPILHTLENKVKFDTYFLMDIDVPWVPDGLRDLGTQRDAMMKVFSAALKERGIPSVLVSGTYEQRKAVVRREIDRLLS